MLSKDSPERQVCEMAWAILKRYSGLTNADPDIIWQQAIADTEKLYSVGDSGTAEQRTLARCFARSIMLYFEAKCGKE